MRLLGEHRKRGAKKGIPNVYSINGILYYELSDGEFSRTDHYAESQNNDE
jgi:hypothetical protein